jgi:S-DNA-T family DNA segregation ATPase FtsK/SpoIIIE
VLDGVGDPTLDAFAELEHCGGVIRVTESERTERLLRRLCNEIDARAQTGRRVPGIALVVDGLAAVRSALAPIERVETSARLDRVLQEGAAVGIVVCATTDGSSTGVLSAIAGDRWVFHLDDRSTARAAGVRAEPAPAVPGRLVIVETQLDAQVVCPTDALGGLPRRSAASRTGGGPAPVTTLPEVVDAGGLGAPPLRPGAAAIVVGLSALELQPAVLEVPAGDHLLIAGAARSGTSTALRQVVASWIDVHPCGSVVAVERRGLLDGIADCGAEAPGASPVLVVVDDADRVDDPVGELAAIAAGRRPGVTLAVAARLEAVRAAYGHWLRDVARSRCGLILTSTGEIDGELLGASLPRRTTIAPRPGLAWLIDRHGHRLVQVAARMPA